MKNGKDEKLKILRKIYKSDFLQPFPYQDCRKILQRTDAGFEDFIPSLDVYFSDVAGYCSSGKRIDDWSIEKIEKAENQMQKSFFDRFSRFSELKSAITERETPQLYNQLLIYDLMRLTLIDILSEIKTEKYSQVTEPSQLPLAS